MAKQIDINAEVKKIVDSEGLKSIISTNKETETLLTVIKNPTKDTVNSQVNKITQDSLKKVTNIETITSKNTGEAVMKSDITNFIKTNFTGDIAVSVNKLIDKSADDIVKEQLKNLDSKINDTIIGEAFNKAKSSYNAIYSSDTLLKNMRSSYTKSMTTSIESIVNKQFSKLSQNKWAGKLLANSQLATKITGTINDMVTKTINQIISDETIKGVTDSVKNTVTAMKKNATNYLKTNFSSQFEYSQKLKKAVQDKIKIYEEAKAKYIKQVTEYVNKLKSQVDAYIKKITQTITDSLQSAIKGLTSSIKF